MKRGAVLVVVGILALAACGFTDRPHAAREVPAVWRDVRAAIGHQKHVGKIACADCHGDEFAKPAADICQNCHAKTSSLHHEDPTTLADAPACTQCHGYGADPAVTPWNCMRCHDRKQGHVPTVGVHAGEDCSSCHQPHGEPATKAQGCTDCHSGRETKHAGLHGCVDCHSMHDAKPTTACASCHTKQQRAINVGHDTCTTCHKPHNFEAQSCASCHKNLTIIAAPKHTCASCHDKHDVREPKRCDACHREPVSHPKPTEGQCVGCHRPHEAPATCATCHSTVHQHATTTKCLDCHTPHGGKPQSTAGLCSKCHADVAKHAAGHSDCTTCHANAAHTPSKQTPACATCHRAEAASAPAGHAQCATCHQPHAPTKIPTCASCHAAQAKTKHAGLDCATCHRPHGPNGIANPPSCASCHVVRTGANPGPQPQKLHAVQGHGDCAKCHGSHEARPKDDRASCLSCHPAQRNHEPTAARCATCHPFK